MSRRILLTDDAIRAALSVDPDVRAPADLSPAIRARIEVSPRRREPWPTVWVSPRSRFILRLALITALLLALLGALLLIGALPPEPSSVSTYSGGPARNGVMPGPAPRGMPVLEWAAPSGPVGPWSPAVVDGVVYQADGRGMVVAVDAATGDTIWQVSVGAPANSGVTVADGLVLTGDVDGVLHALDFVDGSERWGYDAGDRMPGPSAVTDGIAYLGTSSGWLHAVDIATGMSYWPAPVMTAGPVGRSLAALDGVVYVGSAGPTSTDAGTLAAYDAETGEQRWSATLQPGSPSSPAVSEGVVLVVAGLDGRADEPSLSAFDAVTGAPTWPEPYVPPTGDNLYIAAVADGRAYAVSSGGYLSALDLADGTLVWTVETDVGESPNGGYVEGVLYVTGAGSDIIAVGAEGDELWRVTLTASSARAPAVIGGRIIFSTDDGRLVSLTDPAER